MIFRMSLCGAVLLMSVTNAHAQLSASSDEPVDITGEAAEFSDNKIVWTGNVRAIQGEAVLTTNRLAADLNDNGDFESIVATGAVRYSNGKEAITGERAVFDDKNRTITISENVIVTQGKQIMSAGVVVYWVDTGKVKFKPLPGNRIRGIFYTKQDDQS